MFEIVIMALGAIGFITNSYGILLFLLFLMGTQSAFFGPVKYALLPQHLKQNELVPGNALVETGTFLAILIGTIGAGFIASAENAKWLAGICVVLFALFGISPAATSLLLLLQHPKSSFAGSQSNTLRRRFLYPNKIELFFNQLWRLAGSGFSVPLI